MKKFMAVFIGSAHAMNKWSSLPEDELRQRQAEGIKAWYAWVEKNKPAIVELGGPLGRTKRVGMDGVTDIRNAMSGFTIVQAETQEAAAKLFENHPHFAIFPGEAVEVMEVLPVPAA